MNFFGRVARGVKDFYNEINPATLTGAIDVVIIKQPDSTFRCSPFHVRFGKLGVIRSKELIVDIEINSQKVDDLQMVLTENGDAFFIERIALKSSELTQNLDSNNNIICSSIENENDSDVFISETNLNASDKSVIEKDRAPLIKNKNLTITEKINLESEELLGENVQNLINEAKQSNDLDTKYSSVKLSSSNLLKPRENGSKTELSQLNFEMKELENQILNLSENQRQNEVESLKNHNDSIFLDSSTKKLNDYPATETIFKDKSGNAFENSFENLLSDVQLSLCGLAFLNNVQRSISCAQIKLNDKETNTTAKKVNLSIVNKNEYQVTFEDLFQHNLISYDRFLEEINTITSNPNLVVKINDHYLNWSSAAPILLSAIVYRKSLSPDTINMLIKANNLSSSEKSNVRTNKNSLSSDTFSEISTIKGAQIEEKRPNSSLNLDHSGETNKNQNILLENDRMNDEKFNEFSLNKDQKIETDISTQVEDYQKNGQINSTISPLLSDSDEFKFEKQKFNKTNRLSSEIIQKLNLEYGCNEIQYSITTALQGTTKVTSYIYLWNYDDKIIVSDIDGTITKSDVRGHVYPMLGQDWSQAGVADLFTAIERNEYKFVYLSARAIGQSKITREMLRNINQDGFTLPEGPLIVTPYSLITAFQKEVIEKNPEEFKINCLKDIQTLFPSGYSPFYAGYGNKTTDIIAYKAVEIPESKIFIINPLGEVTYEFSGTFQSSYSKLCEYVDVIFPPFKNNN